MWGARHHWPPPGTTFVSKMYLILLTLLHTAEDRQSWQRLYVNGTPTAVPIKGCREGRTFFVMVFPFRWWGRSRLCWTWSRWPYRTNTSRDSSGLTTRFFTILCLTPCRENSSPSLRTPQMWSQRNLTTPDRIFFLLTVTTIHQV